MADKDFSKYSNEELMKIAQGINSNKERGFLNSLGHGAWNFTKGFGKGAAQEIGDLGASAINWPISGVEYLSGHRLPHVPHPSLINKNPDSLGESIGQGLGQFTGAFALPGGAGLKAVHLANRGYQAIRGAKELPLIGKLLAGATGGAVEGAAGNEKNRKFGAKLGGVLGAGGYAIPATIQSIRSLSSKNIVKGIQDEIKNLQSYFSEKFNKSLLTGEEAGANKFLHPEKVDIALLKKAGVNNAKEGEKELTYALEKYNANPTLMHAHAAQRDLNKIIRIHSGATEGTLSSDAYKEALKLKNRLLQKISEAFEKSGTKEYGDIYHQARQEYATEMAPYLNTPTIKALQKGKIREGKFAKAFLEEAGKKTPEEAFLAKKGFRHPSLVQRERIGNILGHPATKYGAVAGGLMLSPYLPEFIRKLL